MTEWSVRGPLKLHVTCKAEFRSAVALWRCGAVALWHAGRRQGTERKLRCKSWDVLALTCYRKYIDPTHLILFVEKIFYLISNHSCVFHAIFLRSVKLHSTAPRNDPRWIPYSDMPGWNIFQHNACSTYGYIIANGDGSDDDSIGTNIYSVTEFG